MPLKSPESEILKAGPLASWDFFIWGYQKMMQKAEDLNVLKKLAKAGNWQVSKEVRLALRDTDYVIVVTDKSQKIVYATQNVLDMTGYTSNEVRGKSPKIFQGTETDKVVVNSLRKRIDHLQPFDAIVVNYRKNGEAYNCHIIGYPLFNSKKELVNFIAFEKAA